MNVSMIQNPKKFFAHCGLCNQNFSSKSGMDKHFRSEKHNRRLHRWYELNGQDKYRGTWDKNAEEVLAEETREEVVKFD